MTKNPEHTECVVDSDGRTSCCGAYTSIFIDDGIEYCKGCYVAVTGYVDGPTERFTVEIPR
jgi:hypothetical protein